MKLNKKILALSLALILAIGSTAFAAVTGDVDGVAGITTADASYLLAELLRGNANEYLDTADVNSDGKINTKDIAIILQKALNPDYEYPTLSVETTEITTEITTETTVITTETTEMTTETTVITTETTTETTVITTETTTEPTTNPNAIYVYNFVDLSRAVLTKDALIYITNDISCNGKLTLSGQGATIVGITKPDGTTPSLNFAAYRDRTSKVDDGISISGANYSLTNLIIENAPGCGVRLRGSSSKNNTFTQCVFRYNNNSGASMTNQSSNNSFIGCDSYRNGDIVQKQGDDADGFSVKLGAGENNSFYNCRAWDNSDDGWDSYDRMSDGGSMIGAVIYEHCLAWNNGNFSVFTGEYDYKEGNPLDKNMLYIKAILNADPDFESKYINKEVTQWPKVTMTYFGRTQTYDNLKSKWGGNPNGFKFGSIETPSTSFRSVVNCIAFDHQPNPHQGGNAKGFDQNNGAAKIFIKDSIAFNNSLNYSMDKMNIDPSGTMLSFGGGRADTGNFKGTLQVPSSAEQARIQAAVYAYRDEVVSSVYSNKAVGVKLCDVFN